MYQQIGRYGEVKEADEQLNAIVRELKEEIMEKCKESRPTECRAISYRSQAVSGTNYVVKVYLGEDEFANVKIFKPLVHTNKPCTLVGVKQGIGRSDDPEPF